MTDSRSEPNFSDFQPGVRFNTNPTFFNDFASPESRRPMHHTDTFTQPEPANHQDDAMETLLATLQTLFGRSEHSNTELRAYVPGFRHDDFFIPFHDGSDLADSLLSPITTPLLCIFLGAVVLPLSMLVVPILLLSHVIPEAESLPGSNIAFAFLSLIAIPVLIALCALAAVLAPISETISFLTRSGATLVNGGFEPVESNPVQMQEPTVAPSEEQTRHIPMADEPQVETAFRFN